MPLVDAQLAQADRNYRRRSAEVRGVLAGFGWAGVGATLGNLFGDIAVGTGAGAGVGLGRGAVPAPSSRGPVPQSALGAARVARFRGGALARA